MNTPELRIRAETVGLNTTFYVDSQNNVSYSGGMYWDSIKVPDVEANKGRQLGSRAYYNPRTFSSYQEALEFKEQYIRDNTKITTIYE